jgi:hypothetical protein
MEKTYKDVFNFCKNYKGCIIEWLCDPWQGKDKQETLLRLFKKLGLIKKLDNYEICKGNFNLKTIRKYKDFRDLFYKEDGTLRKIKDKGDSSDLTCIHKENKKHLLLTTSKNLNNINIGDLDIDKILTNFEQYKCEGYTKTLCICIRGDKENFISMINRSEESSNQLRNYIDDEDTIIIDWNDLKQGYNEFKEIYNNYDLDDIMVCYKMPLCLKMHQKLSVIKTIKLKRKYKNDKILWGHIQRSGKSYIIAGTIIEDSKNKMESNYIIITTAPNETLEQQYKVFDCFQLRDFNIILLNGKNKDPKLSRKNIILCSKQFLQSKIDSNNNIKLKNIGWLKKIKFDIRFIDESHNGGTTLLAKNILNTYGNNSFTIQITATYSKPENDYNILKEKQILWDLEDIKLCKNIEKENNRRKLIRKHGEEIIDILNNYSIENIIEEYSKYPHLWILSNKINEDVYEEILNKTNNNNYGWSSESCFLLKQGLNEEGEIIIKSEFQNEEETLKLWYMIFGKRDKYGIPDESFPDDIVYMKRIEKICHNPETYSRFIGDGDYRNEPMIIMAFLPPNNIEKISKATIKLITNYNIIPDYEIISINSKTTNNPKKSIEDARNKARNSGKKGVLVLSGKQCSLGVSIENCDIVLLLNNIYSYDMINQMMFRCMTEGKNKRNGFVIDLNIHRIIQNMIDYALIIKPEKHPEKTIKYILQERLISLNGDDWMASFGNNKNKLLEICKDIYKIYSIDIGNAIDTFINKINFDIKLSLEDQEILNRLFKDSLNSSKNKELLEEFIEEKKKELNKGIEKIKCDDEEVINSDEIGTDSIREVSEKDIKKDINYKDILKHIIPLICLLTIYDEKKILLIDMFKYIKDDIYLKNILIAQIENWFGKYFSFKYLKIIINIYKIYMIDNKDTTQFIRNIKEIFTKNRHNRKELSKILDKYLIPQELEKKNNAEISTPFKLRQEMLDKMPLEFWTSPKKVFEPCSGKSGFLLDIIDRFMVGLKDMYPDEDERYRVIVEECLYFSDINPMNIYISHILLNPENKYKLNFNEGDTLELDIKEKWDLDGFDAVIGNPPYNSEFNKNGAGAKPIYNIFINFLINKCNYLLFIIPSRWMAGGKGLDKFRNMMMNRKDIQLIKHFDNSKEVFGNIVDIKGGVCYILVNKKYNGLCNYNGINIKLNKYDIIIDKKYYKLVDYLKNYNSIDTIYKPSGYFNIQTNDKKLCDDISQELNERDNKLVKCYVSKQKGFTKYINKKYIKNDIEEWKVITARASHRGKSSFGNIFIGKPNEVCSQSYILFKVNNENEAKSLLSYLQCKLPNLMLSIRKISQDIQKKSLKWIPLPPLDRDWTNDKIYEYFKLSNELINFIRDEKIIGYNK